LINGDINQRSGGVACASLGLENKVRSRLYLGFRLRDFPENPQLAPCAHFLQNLLLLSRLVNNEGYFM